jgi:hypothetical protein
MASRTLTLAFSPFPLLAGVCRDFDSGLDVWFDFCGALVSSAIGKGQILSARVLGYPGSLYNPSKVAQPISLGPFDSLYGPA